MPSVTPKPSAGYVRKVDRSEFARQLVQHERLLFAYIYSLVPDLAAAEEVLQENTGTFDVKHPNLLRLPSGEVLLFYTEWSTMEDRRVLMRRSSDDCRKWSEPLRVSKLPGMNNINNDHVIGLRSGRIVLPSFNSPFYGKGDHWLAFCLYSDDQGRSWQMSDNTIDIPGAPKNRWLSNAATASRGRIFAISSASMAVPPRTPPCFFRATKRSSRTITSGREWGAKAACG